MTTRSSSTTERRMVLVVDDDVASADLMADVLEDAGLSVGVAVDGAAAFAAIERRPPAVLVVDQHLGAESGLALVRRVRNRYPQIAIVAVSGDHEALRAAAEAGLTVVAKPFNAWHLAEIVRDAAGADRRPERVRSRDGGTRFGQARQPA